MPLAAGTAVGPYEILDLVGAGGMGAVYRARDPRLGREVAIKVISTEGAPSAERLRRFEAEARAVAALSHPNVLAVFDVGALDGAPYLVFELLEGETLRARLRTGPLALRSAVETVVQVCRGLQAAHGRGIVHRDLKPENLFLTSGGFVKILDFGLAKLTRGDGASAVAERTQTVAGVVMGTPAYLSPEQARGLEADARSDIFALGAILYEALSGRRAFEGATAADTISAILHDDPPPVRTMSGPVPVAVERVVRRCLAKEREDRFDSAHDLALALEAVLDRPMVAAAGEAAEARGPYPGLSSFTEADAGRFFGREREVEALWQRIRSRRLLAVIGPSGAGKTSFLRAGVVASCPSSGWTAVVTTPGTSPLLMLGQALAPELQGDVEALRQLVRFDDPEAAFDVLVRWRKAHVQALVVVDQFEELFTLCAPEAQARYAALLGRLAGEAGVHVVLSMRDDFLMRCHEHEALAPVFAELTPLGPLGGQELRRALEEPAKAEGFRFEEGLVGKMTTAVEGERGALPLLAFAVSRVWERRDRERKLLTHEAYAEIGGVAGALARHAEETLERIGAERQGMAREIFRNLVTSQGTRTACDREELLSVFTDRRGAEDVLGQLVAGRLLTSWEMPVPEDGDDASARASGRHRIEIVHESLLRSWLRLVRWQAQDADGALLRDQLKQAAHLWDEKGRPLDLLWGGTSFREYELWRERYPGSVTAVEEAFARAMTDRARRRLRLRRAAVATALVGLSAIAIVVSVSRYQAVAARQHAEAEARRAEASKLVALGKAEIEVDPTAALAYARKSLEVHDTAEARRLAVEALWRGPVASLLPMPDGTNGVNFVATSPDGEWLASSWWDGVIVLSSADGQTTRILSKNRNAARPRIVLFSDDSRRLATFADGDSETVVWGVDGQEVARIRPGGYPRRFVGHELVLLRQGAVGGWEFVARRIDNPGEKLLARVDALGPPDLRRGSVCYAKDHSLFSRPLGQRPGASADIKIGEHEGRVAGCSVHDETGWIVSFDEAREVRIWDAATRRRLHILHGLDPDRLFDAPILDPPGRQLAWQSLRQRAYPLWDLAGPPGAEPLLLHKSEVTGENGNGAFLQDGRWLVTALNTKVAFWPLQMPWPRVLRRADPGSSAVVFTPDSKQIVSCGATASLVYPLTLDAPPARPIGPNSGSFTCYGVAMEPAGSHVLFAATTWAVFLAPLDGGEAQALLRVPSTESICPVAFDAAGRWVATAACYAPEVKDRLLHVIDRRTGVARAFPLPAARERPDSYGVNSLRFVAGGRLMAAGDAGLRIWDPETGEQEVLNANSCWPMDASADGRRVAVTCAAASPEKPAEPTKAGAVAPPLSSDLLVFDLTTKAHRKIESHGRDVQALALSPSGDVIATGDSAGTIRVGRADGSEPHLIVGAGGPVISLAVSPDGRWLASSVGSDIRLWPMPDLSRPPLHTLARQALIAKLGTLTNVRVVEDPASSSGYRVDLAPFPGWKDVPTW
jgi:eukaryotic-like serine/threonine-protein kinase